MALPYPRVRHTVAHGLRIECGEITG